MASLVLPGVALTGSGTEASMGSWAGALWGVSASAGVSALAGVAEAFTGATSRDASIGAGIGSGTGASVAGVLGTFVLAALAGVALVGSDATLGSA